MIYLDTHVLLWLFGGHVSKVPPVVRSFINRNDLLVSPIVLLELTFLHEIGRFVETSDEIVADLSRRVGLKVCQLPLADIVSAASRHTWTRDPFDRMITGHAALRDRALVTKDSQIRTHYPFAFWSD